MDPTFLANHLREELNRRKRAQREAESYILNNRYFIC
jgi:hypothetical protein